MKKNMLLIAGATLLISAFSAGLIRAQTCIQPPTCEELGYIYSADECVNGNNILKCPTDLSKMACSFDAIGNDGDILYADHSISSEVINAKTPIAVIFDAGNRLAVSLEAKIYQKGDSVIWGAEGDIPGLANCSGTDCEDSSITNTNMIMSYGEANNKSYPMAESVRSYSPAGCKQAWCGAGKWSMLSMGDFKKIYAAQKTITATFKKLGKSLSSNNWNVFLTSSPYDKTSYNAYSFFVGVDANLVPPKSGEGFDAIWDLALPNGASWQFMLFRVIRY